jgi:PAS domain S-box-containing protein
VLHYIAARHVSWAIAALGGMGLSRDDGGIMTPHNRTIRLTQDDGIVLPALVLNSLNAGVYVTDVDRRIVYWNQTAQRITGWRSQDILGKACHEQVLCHVDKDDRPLCGEEFCPLHRAITTGTSSDVPIVVFALSARKRRVPMRVSVAPLRDSDGRTIGGVEMFLDMSQEVGDMQRAQRIQAQCLLNEAGNDPRLAVRMHYTPHDMIGGDFCAVSRAGPDHYAFIVADVMGHGLSAALYTMYLRSLWDEYCRQKTPAAILAAMNKRLSSVMSGDGGFATAVCGTVDVPQGRLFLASAGGPTPLLCNKDGCQPVPEMSGLPMGLLDQDEYNQVEQQLGPDGRLLLFSDGLVEVRDGQGQCLETDGLIRLLQDLQYPARSLDVPGLEERLLKYSNAIRFDDDITLLELRLGSLAD